MLFAVVLLAHRLIYGPQEEGALWTLFAVLFFLHRLDFSRAWTDRRIRRTQSISKCGGRPTYIVRAVHGADSDNGDDIRDPTANPIIRKSWIQRISAARASVKAARLRAVRLPRDGIRVHGGAAEDGRADRGAIHASRRSRTKKSGGGRVRNWPRTHGVPVYYARKLETRRMPKIGALNPPIIYSFYYRHLIPESVLELGSARRFNLHGRCCPRIAVARRSIGCW